MCKKCPELKVVLLAKRINTNKIKLYLLVDLGQLKFVPVASIPLLFSIEPVLHYIKMN